MFLVVGAGDAVRARQRLPVDLQTDHHEVAVVETQCRIPRRLEAEQGFVPVMDFEHALDRKRRHGPSFLAK